MILANVFRNRWWVVLASVSGLIVGAGSINIFAFGVFLKPISDDLGLGRGVISSAAGMTSILSALASPVFGKLLDDWGIRPVLLPSIALFAIAVASLSFLQASPAYLYVLFPIVGLTSVGQTPAAYSKAVSAWFDKQRGLALGVALAGVGLGTAVIPQLSEFLIGSFGWRNAYVGLGVAIIILAFIPAAIFIREPAAESEPRRQSPQTTAAGMMLGEALRGSWRYWALTLAFFLGAASINGTLTHVVPLLTDRGFPIAVAVGALSGSGLAIIAGRIFSGYCLDKIFGPYVAIVFFLLPLTGIALLYGGAAGPAPLVGTFLCGLGIGAEFDLMAFFVGRYFGMKSFGALYGLMFGVSQIGNAVGSNIMGWSFQILHSYVPALGLFVAALGITCLLFLPLGSYPYGPVRKAGSKPETGEHDMSTA
jgi:MFS family permease